MELTKEAVKHCRCVGALRDFLSQAMDQIDEKDKEIAELKMEHHKERDEYIDWVNRLQKENAELKEVYKVYDKQKKGVPNE